LGARVVGAGRLAVVPELLHAQRTGLLLDVDWRLLHDDRRRISVVRRRVVPPIRIWRSPPWAYADDRVMASMALPVALAVTTTAPAAVRKVRESRLGRATVDVGGL